MNTKKKDPQICNMQWVLDRLMNQVEVQATRAQTLMHNKAPKLQVTNQCEILRQTIQEGTKIEASLTAACEALHSAMEGCDEAATKEFESINDKMIGLISNYQFKFQDLQWKYQDILASFSCLLDNGWSSQLRDREECKNATLEAIFEVMNQILLIRYPLSIRRIDYRVIKEAPNNSCQCKYGDISSCNSYLIKIHGMSG